MRRIKRVAFALTLLLAVPAHAVIIPLSATIDCVQEVPSTCSGTSGSGSASITLDNVTNLLSWNISWSGLSGTPTLMHFHGPALPNQNAGVQVNTGVAGPPVVGNAVLAAGQVNDLLAGLWYLNLHTTTFAAGEIRGQVTVIPEPGTLLLLAGGLTALVAFRRYRTR